MKRRRPASDGASAPAAGATDPAPGKRPRAGGGGGTPAPSTGADGFYPMPAAAHDADPDDRAPPSFVDSLLGPPRPPAEDDWRGRRDRLAAALRTALAHHDQLERRTRAGDADAGHALRRLRAQLLALAEELHTLDPAHPLLRALPPELVAEAGAGATIESLIEAGRDEVDADPAAAPPGVAPMLCEDTPADGEAPGEHACWLDPIERTRVVGLLADRAETSANRWLAAVEHGVSDELMNHHSAWGLIAEVLFNIASFGATSAIARTAAALARTRLPETVRRALTVASEPRNIKDVVSILGKGAREKLKTAVTSRPRVTKMEVLLGLRDLPGAWKDEVHVAALTALDDADLLAVTAALAPDRPELSSDAYDARVHQLVEGFDTNVLAIGRVDHDGHSLTSAARFAGPAGTRLALVRYDQQHVQRSGLEADLDGDNRFHFVQWIDTDYAPTAAERQRALLYTTPLIQLGDSRLANPDHPDLVRWSRVDQ